MNSMVEAAVRGMLAVPPLYKNAPDAHAQLGGPSRNPGKARWLQAVNKLHRTRIASRRVDAKEVFVWSEASSGQQNTPTIAATSRKAAPQRRGLKRGPDTADEATKEDVRRVQRQDQAQGGKSVLKGCTAADRGRPAVSHKPEHQAPRRPWIRKRRLPPDASAAELEREKLRRRVDTRSESQVAAQAKLDRDETLAFRAAFKQIVALARKLPPPPCEDKEKPATARRASAAARRLVASLRSRFYSNRDLVRKYGAA